MTILYYGCNCGSIGHMIRKVTRYGRENNIEVRSINTKYDKEHLSNHAQYLDNLGRGNGGYPAIIIEEESVTLLSEWKR